MTAGSFEKIRARDLGMHLGNETRSLLQISSTIVCHPGLLHNDKACNDEDC